MAFTFIHAADIHLDSKLKGLEQYEGAPVEKIRSATRDAFINLVDEAINRKVSFIIIAGDVYDSDWKDYNSGLFFSAQMVRLKKHDISVFLIRGNHDAISVITKELKLPENVKEFSFKESETVIVEDLGVAIHGQSFASRSVEENLVKEYPKRVEGFFNIGILHTSASGSNDHDTYAPCSIEDMKEKGYDYWALGHIHIRHFLHQENPVILFPGNIQGRHIKETGDKGCTIVNVEDGRIGSLTEVSLNVLQWELCEIDASTSETLDDLLEVIRNKFEEVFQDSGGKFLAVRCKIFGSTEVHQDLIIEKEHFVQNVRNIANEVGVGDIWVEKVKIETIRQVDISELRKRHTPISFILDYIKELQNDETMLKEILSDFHDIGQDLPFELRNGEDAFNFNDVEQIKKQIPEVEDLILYYLTTKVEVNS